MANTERIGSPREAKSNLRRARDRVRYHYGRVMPDNPRHRTGLWVFFWVVSAIILLQLMYPPTRAVPTAMLNRSAEGWRDESQLAAEISQLFDDTIIKLEINNQSVDVPLKQIGAAPETAAMVSQMTHYPFWQRYIPLSLLWQQARVDSAVLSYTSAVASERCRQLADQMSRPASNARLELVDGRLVASDEQPGLRVDPTKLCRDIQGLSIELGGLTNLEVDATLIKPQLTNADFAQVRAQAEQALARTVIFTYTANQYRPSAQEVASWLMLTENKSGQTELQVDRQRIKDYLVGLNKSLGRPAGVTDVRIVNGIETQRRTGEPGSQINYKSAVDATSEQLLGRADEQAIELELVELAPTLMYNSRYTATKAGLQAYVTDAARDYNARIMLRQLGGDRWEVGARQFESIPSASTYKVYVATWLFNQMEQGKISWNTPILDTNTSVCFDRMTIASTNACAEEWLAQAGRANINQYLYGLGVSRGTTFTSPIATNTTAADLTNHMTKIARGEMYPDIYRQRLYKSLSTHPYRYAIPVGSRGQVYDKVGFLWDYVHDTAIVKHPRGDYVLTIMTKGQSYARIASIAREIERIMYP